MFKIEGKNKGSKMKLKQNNNVLEPENIDEFKGIYNKKEDGNKRRHFIAIKFQLKKTNTSSDLVDNKFGHYNFKDYWTFEIKINEKIEKEIVGDSYHVTGYEYEILRRKSFFNNAAELPNLEWRIENFDKYKSKKNK